MSDATILPAPAPNLDRLLVIMTRLRAPEGGCPWDLEQDHRTLRPYLLEEAYEVLEAIDAGDDVDFQEELGDLLLQIVFHARVAEDRGAFNFDAVAKGIADKLEERHPHIFGDVEVADADEVARNWEAIKAKKKQRDSVLDGVPAALPSLTRAGRIQEKASSVGFDWAEAADVTDKIVEEAQEFAEVAKTDTAAAGQELGDLLFSLVNWSRKAGFDPESELREATLRFEGRFRHMEKTSATPLRELNQPGLEKLWEAAKSRDRECSTGTSTPAG